MVCTDVSAPIFAAPSSKAPHVLDHHLRTRVDGALRAAMARADAPSQPPRLAEAIGHAVFAGGGRVRPRLCLAVAQASGEDRPALSDGVAVAIELLHCASLVHDDLPCFDDAPTRRGRPSVHAAFGEAMAVLVGDALIVRAFEELAIAGAAVPSRLPALLMTVARGVGTPDGIIAGQALELEPDADLDGYHAAKTGALFEAAAVAGALAAGSDPEPWRGVGARLGLAYQIADDVHDVMGQEGKLGKPVQRDAALGRPNAVAELGLDASKSRGRRLIAHAIDLVPPCRERETFRGWLDHWGGRLGLSSPAP